MCLSSWGGFRRVARLGSQALRQRTGATSACGFLGQRLAGPLRASAIFRACGRVAPCQSGRSMRTAPACSRSQVSALCLDNRRIQQEAPRERARHPSRTVWRAHHGHNGRTIKSITDQAQLCGSEWVLMRRRGPCLLRHVGVFLAGALPRGDHDEVIERLAEGRSASETPTSAMLLLVPCDSAPHRHARTTDAAMGGNMPIQTMSPPTRHSLGGGARPHAARATPTYIIRASTIVR